MKLIACGGRDFRNRQWLWDGLYRLHGLHPITELIEGGAEGADRYAQEWAIMNGVPCFTVHAEWSLHGKSAGYKRNLRMLEMGPDMVFAAPGGRGTAMMADIATRADVPVVYLAKMGLNAEVPVAGIARQ